MNTEATQDTTAANSTGARLRAAREQMGLTQQNVAERLCLKLSTVRDIEEDKSPADLASTFTRLYPLLRPAGACAGRGTAADDGEAGSGTRGESRTDAELFAGQAT